MIRKRVVVRGVVQGVGFRYHTRIQAAHLGLVGFARNQPDGSVEVEIEGRSASIARMLLWLQVGPRSAVVESFDVSDLAHQGDSDFRIIA